MPDPKHPKNKRSLTPADLEDIRKIIRYEIREALIEGGIQVEPAGTEPPDDPDNP
jgi:hypothetical protein